MHPGMRLGEALARCPRLALVPPDPVGVADAWEQVVARLEAIGAAVEAPGAGLAFFEARMRCGGCTAGAAADDPAAALRARAGGPPPWLDALVAVVRRGLRRARAHRRRAVAVLRAGGRARARGTAEPTVVDGAAALAGEPVALLRRRDETAALVEPLERLGIATLGALAALPRGDGRRPLRRRRAARARPRSRQRRRRCARACPGEVLEEVLELPESASGEQLERALGLLVDRLLARASAAAGRCAPSCSARGSSRAARGASASCSARRWPTRRGCGSRSASGWRCCPRRQRSCGWRSSASARRTRAPGRCSTTARRSARARLREAVRQARAAAGPEAALRVLEVDPDSRVPERRAVLAPFELTGDRS